MKTFVKLYKRSRTGAKRYWQANREGAKIHIEWGVVDTPNPTRTIYYGEVKNAGKANEISTYDDTVNEQARLVLSKKREGYTSSLEDQVYQAIDLPLSMRVYKPKSSITTAIRKSIQDNDMMALRKYDGECMIIAIRAGKCTILSRTMLESHHLEDGKHTWNDRFPHLVQAFEGFFTREDFHIFAGEITGSSEHMEKDQRDRVASVMRSETGEALLLQKRRPLCFMIWDWVLKDGEKHDKSVYDRWVAVRELARGMRMKTGLYVNYAEQVWNPSMALAMHGNSGTDPDKVLDRLMGEVKRSGWEGLVLSKASEGFVDKLFNFRGKEDRPNTLCKLKPVYEDDFFAYWDPEEGDGKYGKGKHKGLIGSVDLYQYDSEGNAHYICDCGGGMDDTFRATYTKDDFPLVMEVKYESRTYILKGEKTNALQFPRMVRVRTDKAIEECINERL